MDNDSWIREARKSRIIMHDKWISLGKPQGDFYAWLVDQVDNHLLASRMKTMGKIDQDFKNTIG